jgi:Lon protease-like protein
MMALTRIVCVVSLVATLSGSAGAQTLPSAIPLFPLPDFVLFPGAARPLLIFEPRYRAMVADALKGDRIIGTVLLRPGFEADYEGRPPIHAIGCAGRITQSELLPDGRYVIELRGFAKFRVAGEDHSRLYRVARVEEISDAPDGGDMTDLDALRLRLETLLAASLPSDSQLYSLPDEEFVNRLAQDLGFEPADRQLLLELKGPAARARALIERLETRVTPLNQPRSSVP